MMFRSQSSTPLLPFLILSSSSPSASTSRISALTSLVKRKEIIARLLIVLLLLMLASLGCLIVTLQPSAVLFVDHHQDLSLSNNNSGPNSSNNNRQLSRYDDSVINNRSSVDGIAASPHWIDLAPPMSRESLGAATWSFLHSLAAVYPEDPSADQRHYALSLFISLSHLYPCPICKEHFQQFLQSQPPRVDSRSELSRWLCEAHNSVNERLQKPLVDCSAVQRLWPPELKECGCDVAEGTQSETGDPLQGETET